mgnify:CR=1 FL=1|tara:strand:+ start:38 stop:697 length:660 start_codon:yes stop_codon:yes gene_type:complete
MTPKIVQQTTSNFHQAFPLIVYEKKLSGFLSSLYKSFEDGKFDNSTGKIVGEHHGKVLIHHDKRLRPFFKQVTNSVYEYLDYFKIDKSAFKVNFVKTWFTICDPQQTLPMHYHSCSHISWIYYIQTPGDPLVLHHKNPNEWFGDAFRFITENRFNNGDGYVINPTTEHLIMFPSSIEHYTSAEDRQHQRISLVGDIILTLKDRTDSESGLLPSQYWKQF